ncbi:hypothetical protein BDN72DRAFT_879103 [Pluteus cervinus]|uniref:Uncharacterized protein n=1 Tax=Pluteus cervinus TaxID=181527 RepID=A0ACD3ARW4_9AGAR|nr:hypothetical protein BDN72DRAFT_879103 [Pluteus cervinus]
MTTTCVAPGRMKSTNSSSSLFSAVVTAFTAGSYQWLQDPTDPNTNLLVQLVQLQINNANPVSSEIAVPVAPAPPFKPTASSVRINVVWFLSLTLSLGTVLIGVLCLQWLREFRRRTAGPLQHRLARRQMAFDGLDAWRVPEIISSLSLILELALILFLVGLVDLLWMLHHTVAMIVVIPIAILMLFVIITTAIPAVELILGERADGRPRCPYRSPQALLACNAITLIRRALRFIIPSIPPLPCDQREQTDWGRGHWWSWDNPCYQFKGHEVHLARAIEWIQRNFGFTTEIMYNLYHCLTELDDEELARFATANYSQLDVRGGTNHRVDPDVLREFTYLVFLHASVGLGTKTFDPFIDEHYIRVLNSDPSVPRAWVKEHSYTPAEIKVLEPSMQEEFINQRLLCALTLFEQNSPAQRDLAINIWKELRYPTKHLHRFSPQTDELLQQVLCEIKRWLLNGHFTHDSLASPGTIGYDPTSPSANSSTCLMALTTPPPSPGSSSPRPIRGQHSPNSTLRFATLSRHRPNGTNDLDLRTRVRLCAYGIQSLLKIINALPPCTLKARYADLAWTVKDQSLKVTDRNHTRDWPELALETVLLWKQPMNSPGHGRGLSSGGASTNGGRSISFSLADGVGGSFYKEQEWLTLFGVESMRSGPDEGADLGEEDTGDHDEPAKELWFMEHLNNLQRNTNSSKGKEKLDGNDLGADGEGFTIEIEGEDALPYSPSTLVNGHSRSTTLFGESTPGLA